MKNIFFILLFFTSLCSSAQLHIETILPDKPIIVNEPFRIQFVIQNPAEDLNFEAPDFKNIKVIHGPELYKGTQTIDGTKVPIINYIYTLVSNITGNFQIAPAIVKVNGLVFIGNDFVIPVYSKKVIPEKQDDISEYVLKPNEDPYKKIRNNLFVKLFVNKQTCYVGEPIVATFKLFSRLQSKSDIVKNPGFYGFSVYDMINLDDRVKETERINGKEFDVHTIRKVQLYPLQAGEYKIDEMKIENKVEFSRSVVNKKTEQEISEGILREPDDHINPGSEVYETTVVTEPVKIKVHPLPSNNIPIDFNGAAGQFTIHVTAEKNKLDKNEEGFLIVTIEGKGNFKQLTAPVVQWPKELEGFDPSVKDFLDKRLVPLSGARIFRYPFISSQPGKWKIPPIRFSFFNGHLNKYQTISSDSLWINISKVQFKKAETEKIINEKTKPSIEETNREASRIAFSIIIGLIIAAICYWLFAGKRRKKKEETVSLTESIGISYETFTNENLSQTQFYNKLYHAIWKYLGEKFRLSGTEMNKNVLLKRLESGKNNELTIKELLGLLNELETAQFTSVDYLQNRSELIEKTKAILSQVAS